jgi:lysophospholipase L1-like esterase
MRQMLMKTNLRFSPSQNALALFLAGTAMFAATGAAPGATAVPGLLTNGTAQDPIVQVDPQMANPLDSLLAGYAPPPAGALPIRGEDGRTVVYAPPQTQPFPQTPSRYWGLVYNSDPADLKKFRDANAKLGEPKEGEERVVFLGDSITEGWARYFPTNFPGKTNYIGRGISSETTLQMLVRFRPDVVNLKPKVVVILAGVNDIAGNTGAVPDQAIHDNFKSMADIARANNIKVVLISTLPATRMFWQPSVNPTQRVVDLARWQEEFAAQNGLYFVDAHAAMKDENNGMPSKYSGDSVHPNAAGYALLAQLVQVQIDKALKGQPPAR